MNKHLVSPAILLANISEGGGVFTPINFLIHESDLQDKTM